MHIMCASSKIYMSFGETGVKMDYSKILKYDPESGDLTWKVKVRGYQIGDVAGFKWKSRNITYIRLSYLGEKILGHRVAWELFHGEKIPNGMMIDHLDGDGTNNSIHNLRVVTNQENQRNAKVNKNSQFGIAGVRFCTRNKGISGWFEARVRHNNECKYLGTFKTLLDACAERIKANNKYGYTIRHGR